MSRAIGGAPPSPRPSQARPRPGRRPGDPRHQGDSGTRPKPVQEHVMRRRPPMLRSRHAARRLPCRPGLRPERARRRRPHRVRVRCGLRGSGRRRRLHGGSAAGLPGRPARQRGWRGCVCDPGYVYTLGEGAIFGRRSAWSEPPNCAVWPRARASRAAHGTATPRGATATTASSVPTTAGRASARPTTPSRPAMSRASSSPTPVAVRRPARRIRQHLVGQPDLPPPRHRDPRPRPGGLRPRPRLPHRRRRRLRPRLEAVARRGTACRRGHGDLRRRIGRAARVRVDRNGVDGESPHPSPRGDDACLRRRRRHPHRGAGGRRNGAHIRAGRRGRRALRGPPGPDARPRTRPRLRRRTLGDGLPRRRDAVRGRARRRRPAGDGARPRRQRLGVPVPRRRPARRRRRPGGPHLPGRRLPARGASRGRTPMDACTTTRTLPRAGLSRRPPARYMR